MSYDQMSKINLDLLDGGPHEALVVSVIRCDEYLTLTLNYIGVATLLAQIGGKLAETESRLRRLTMTSEERSADMPAQEDPECFEQIDLALTEAATFLNWDYHRNGRGFWFEPKRKKENGGTA